MRLLFDENLGARLVRDLASDFPDSAHLSQLGLIGASDQVVWAVARDGGYVLVTKDDDFHRMSVVHGFPPKIVWIRIGNCTNADVAFLVRSNKRRLESFVADDDVAFIALG